MKRKLLTMMLFLMSLAMMQNSLFAQDEDLEIWDDSFWDDEFKSTFSIENPVIELKYGMGEPSIDKDAFLSAFKKIQSVEARFGFSEKTDTKYDPSVFEYEFNYFYVSNISSDWNKSNDISLDINTAAWQFGFAGSEGYGYKLGEKTDLVLYNTSALAWTSIDFKDTSIVPNDQKKMDYIGDDFRFGEYWEGGIRFQVYEPIALTAGYQRILVMPRLLFWKWAGGAIVQGIGEGVIGWFTDEVLEASPQIGPVVNFILKNAYSYGIYELRKKKMNWPFETEAPMMYDNFKVGVSFAF